MLLWLFHIQSIENKQLLNKKLSEHLKDAKKTKKPPKQTKKGRPKKKPADDLRLQQEAAWMFQVFVLVHVYACVHSRCRGGSRGGLRVLKHPPKLPKINYLLFRLIVNLLSEFRYYQLNNSIIQHLCLLMKLKS